MEHKMRASIYLILLALLPLSMFSCTAEEREASTLYLENMNVTTIEATNISLGDAPLLIPAYGEIYITTPYSLVATLADTYYLITSPTTSGEIKGFSNNGQGRLTYTDVTPVRVALVNSALSLTGTDPADLPNTISVQVFKNSVGIPSSIAVDTLSVQDRVESIPMVNLVTLIETGDYLETYISSSKANADLTIQTMAIITTTVD